MARIYKVSTSTANLGISAAPPLFVVNDPGHMGTGWLGMMATNGLATAPYYVKFYWTGNQNLTYSQMTSLITNAACTVVPQLTIEVPIGGTAEAINPMPVIYPGDLYFWAVSTAADGTNTSLAAGGDTITVFID